MDNGHPTRFCKYCGKPLIPDTSYCSGCGRTIDDSPSGSLPHSQNVPTNENLHIPPGADYNMGSGSYGQPPGGRKGKGLKICLIAVLCLVLIAASVFGFLKLSGNFNIFNTSKDTTGGSGDGEAISGRAEEKQPDESRVVQTKDWGEVPANQVIIIFKDDVKRKDAEKRIKTIGGRIAGEMEIINLYQVETDGSTEEDLKSVLDKAKALEGVENVFPNVKVYPAAGKGQSCSSLNDPFYKEGQNGKPNEIIGLQNAWNIIKASGVGLNNVQVGVMDSAVYDKSDEINGESEIEGDKTPDPAKDKNGNIKHSGLTHGTMVTHVIGANGKNGGMSGVASVLGNKLKVKVKNIFTGPGITQTAPNPDEPTIYTDIDGKAYIANTLVKMQKMVESGASIINCSFGPDHPEPNNGPMAAAYKKFFEYMAKKHPDVIFVAAAGNEGDKQKTKGALNGSNYWPGGLKLPNVITVGAIDNEGKRAGFSNFAEGDGEVTISAPGVRLPLGNGSDGKPVYASGTSFATPQVASAAALIRSINPKLSAEQIKTILAGTAAPGVVGKDVSIPIEDGMGSGVLNIENAGLKVVNDLRAEKGLSPFNKDKFLALCTIDVKGKGGPEDFKITASLKEIGEKPVTVKIELLGEGAIGGNSSKTLSAPGEVSWDVTIAKDSANVRVTRLDTGG